MNKEMYLKLVVAVVILVLVSLLGMKLMKVMGPGKTQENFKSCPYKNVHPDVIAKDYISENEKKMNGGKGDKLDQILDKLDEHQEHDENYVKKSAVEMAAKSAAGQYCPVAPDFDITQYVKKTEVNEMVKCPEVPDMRDFVLKSSIPPASKCPSCICPKVNVSAGFCKKCPEPKDICPKPAPCGVEQCKNVIKCPPCPVQKAPPIPRCPAPQACPTPPPCKEGGRCPPNKCPKCKYYGIKTVETSKSIEELINDLINGNDPDKMKKINALRELLGVKVPEGKKEKKPLPSNVDNDMYEPTRMASEPEDKSYLKPVVDYDNKCVDNSLFYSAGGVMGSDF